MNMKHVGGCVYMHACVYAWQPSDLDIKQGHKTGMKVYSATDAIIVQIE